MTKDKTLLSGVSKYFTEDTLLDIIRKKTGDSEAIVKGWTFAPPAPKGDSYLSQVDRVTVHGTSKDQPCELKLVVKSLPKNMGRRKTYRSTDFFHNEITFYEKILPAFEKFIESKGQKHLLSVPDCLASKADGEDDFLALLDVSVLGFGPVSRLSCLNLEQMNVLLVAMASFHAISFAYKDQNKAEFDALTNLLTETYFSENHWDWYKNFHAIMIRVARDALAKEYPGHPAELKFNSYEPPKKLWEKSSDFCSRRYAPTAVVNQGDSWAPNFLVRHLGNDKGRQQALLLDFQLARVASPVVDLSFLIYACSDKQLLDEHFDDMLKTYHDAISKGIRELGSDPDKIYPWFLFSEEVKEQSIHGLNFSIEAVPFSMLDESEAFDLDLIKGDEAIDIAQIWQVQNIKTSAGRRRLADLILHAESRGFL